MLVVFVDKEKRDDGGQDGNETDGNERVAVDRVTVERVERVEAGGVSHVLLK